LVSVNNLVGSDSMQMEVIVNPKVVCFIAFSTTKDDFVCLQQLDDGSNVIQLETAAGAAIKNFKSAVGMLMHFRHLRASA